MWPSPWPGIDQWQRFILLIDQSQHNEALDCSFQESYPRHLVTYKLGEGEEITLDGNMDEEAWQQVEWSQDFTDIRFYTN